MQNWLLQSGFFDFLRGINYHIYQEREWGLDIYLSGWWALAPAILAVVSATVFVLALFHLIPLRRHSIPLLLSIGLLAFSCGLAGTYSKYRSIFLHPEIPPPRVFSQGAGTHAADDGQKAALLAWPLVVGAGVAAVDLLGAAFLLVFGGQDPKKPGKKSRSRDEEKPA